MVDLQSKYSTAVEMLSKASLREDVLKNKVKLQKREIQRQAELISKIRMDAE